MISEENMAAVTVVRYYFFDCQFFNTVRWLFTLPKRLCDAFCCHAMHLTNC